MNFLSLENYSSFKPLKKPIGTIYIYTFIVFASVNLITPILSAIGLKIYKFISKRLKPKIIQPLNEDNLV